jgi:hypothetical protein
MKAAALEDNAWPDDALATIIGLSHTEYQFSAVDLAREMRPPPNPNWVGQAFSRARALGFITHVRYERSTSKSRKNGVVSVWCRRVKGVPS